LLEQEVRLERRARSASGPLVHLALSSSLAESFSKPLHQSFEIWVWPKTASDEVRLPFHRDRGAVQLTRFYSASLSPSLSSSPSSR